MFTKNNFRYILALIALFLVIILRGQPKVPERPFPQKLVNDFAGLLTSDERQRLENELVYYNDSSSNQVTVVTIRSLGDYPIEDWALEIGRKWGVGRKGKNNGVVILVSLEPRKVNISPGYGLEGALPDITCKRIINSHIVPAFKQQQYFTGLSNAIKAIRSAIKGEYSDKKNNESDSFDGFWVFIILLVILMVILIIIANTRKRSAGYGSRGRRYYDNDSGGGGWVIWGGGGGWGSGGGGSDSGGFGGFGGGDFGGGGASGDW